MIPFEDTKGEVVFTHEDDSGVAGIRGSQRMFAVERILATLNRIKDKIQVYRIPLDKEFANWMLHNRGIEVHRLTALIGFSTLEPVIFCAEEDAEETYLLIDGSHRYVAAVINENTHIRAYVLPKEVWEKFLIAGPVIDIQKLVRGYSGI